MSKLNEIETKMDQTIWTVPATLSRGDVLLLIRAVRELGRETMAWYSSRPDLATERIDPDVLELIRD